jgi:23S rRNA (guanosine2251-2'-O)-methyltransferase
VEHLLLCPVDDLAGALADLHGSGLRVAGSEADAPLTARQADLRGPLALVVGSEGQGLGPAVRKRCDLLMRIPMRGSVGSLNAAVAGSILLFEAVAQRDPEGRSQPRSAEPWPEPRRPARTHGGAGQEAAPIDPETVIAEPVSEPAAEPAEPVADVPAGDEAQPEASAEEDASPSVDDATPSDEGDLLPEALPAAKPPRAKRARPPKSI